VNIRPPAKAKKARKTAAKGPRTPATKTDAPQEHTHRQRFDQLLDDVVFGKATKR
jgi:hypothetical protein